MKALTTKLRETFSQGVNVYRLVVGIFMALVPFIFDGFSMGTSILFIAAGTQRVGSIWLTERNKLFYIVNGICVAFIVAGAILIFTQK